MAKQDADQELSIEEILNSIRQIISDDEVDATAQGEPEKPEAPSSAPVADPFVSGDDDDVIELKDRVEDEPAFVPEDIAPEPEIIVEMQEALPQEPVPIIAPPPEPEPVMETPPPPAQPPQKPPPPLPPRPAPVESDSLLTDMAEDAAFSAFSELARKTAVEYGGITLEEIVRSELKPMLRDWLDRHLPSMIERLVQEELERVSKRVIGD